MTGHPHARHLTDEELVLVYFDEFSDRPGAEAHLAVCESCRRGLADLGETLALVADHQEVEAPDGFERVMWARVERQLQDATPRGVAHLVRAASPRAGRRRGVTGAGGLRGRPLDHADDAHTGHRCGRRWYRAGVRSGARAARRRRRASRSIAAGAGGAVERRARRGAADRRARAGGRPGRRQPSDPAVGVRCGRDRAGRRAGRSGARADGAGQRHRRGHRRGVAAAARANRVARHPLPHAGGRIGCARAREGEPCRRCREAGKGRKAEGRTGGGRRTPEYRYTGR